LQLVEPCYLEHLQISLPSGDPDRVGTISDHVDHTINVTCAILILNMTISFYSLGCKLNYAELEEIKEAAKKLGLKIIPWKKPSNLSVIAACSVTKNAEKRTEQIIRAIKRKGAKIIVIGCLPRSSYEQRGLRKKIPEIDYLCKSPKEAIKKLKTCFASILQKKERYKKIQNAPQRTRSFIKIQSGCVFNCSYCLSRILRNRIENVSPQEIIKKIKDKEKMNCKEIVLTGLNVLLYKHRKTNIVKLIKKILKETKIQRIRFGSIDPRLVTDEFIRLFKNPRLLPHLHLSIQSGSSKILKMMNRYYTPKTILKIVRKFRRLNPLFTFTTDIIAGFPEETKSDIKKTCEIIKKIQFLKVHIFPFSFREGTPLETKKMNPSQTIPLTTSISLIKKAAAYSRKNWLKKFYGLYRPVLFEQKNTGFTPEYIKIKLKSKESLFNQIKEIKITKSRVLE